MLVLVFVLGTSLAGAADPLVIHVSPGRPLASLTAARDAIRRAPEAPRLT